MRKLICPTCYGSVTVMDGANAVCTLNGHRFQVLHLREGLFATAPPAPAMPPPTFAQGPASGTTQCAQHPSVVADRVCASCGTPLCGTCAFPADGGQSLCVNCIGQPRTPGYGPVVVGAKCINHPAVDAVARCTSCSAPVCRTCDFVFDGDLHVCPNCATRTEAPLSPKRRKNLIISFVLAGVATLSTFVFFVAAVAVTDEAALEAMGAMLMFLGFGPSAIGMGLGLAVRDRRLSTPPVAWVAIVWNGLVLAGLIALVCFGLFAEMM